MSDTAGQGGSGGSAPPPHTVAALVEAMDVRARQAGSEGAASMLRSTLNSISEVLAGIEERLDGLEDRLAGQTAPAAALVEHVQVNLATFNTRLGRLEEAFVKAVDNSGSGSDALVDQLRQAMLTALADSPRVQPVPQVDPVVAERLGAIEQRLQAIEEAIRREAELLTQRVAALAVGVEASRVLLERHVEDTENSLGRKATEVTRRLASDFGLRNRRAADPGTSRRGDPRQIGPGS